jgi:uncharacterized protein (TIGR03086 family)
MSTMPLEMAIASTRKVLSAVQADQMSAQSPCASWKASDVINHIVGGQYFFAAGASGQMPSGESPDFSAGDFVAAFDEAAAACVAAFQADGVLQSTLKLPFGEMPGMAFAGLAAMDTFTHGWDLAKATGQSTDLAPQLAEQMLAQASQMIPDSFRGPEGAPFGPAKEAPDGATAADKLAAFLGRSC